MRVPSCHVYAWRFQGLVLSLNADSVPLASQAMRDGATYAEARATANTEEAARTAAQTAGDGLPEDMPLFTEMMQRLDRVASLFHSLSAAHSLNLLGHPESHQRMYRYHHASATAAGTSTVGPLNKPLDKWVLDMRASWP